MFPFFTECVQPTHAASHFLQAFLEMQLSYEPHMSACLVGWIGGPYFLKKAGNLHFCCSHHRSMWLALELLYLSVLDYD